MRNLLPYHKSRLQVDLYILAFVLSPLQEEDDHGEMELFSGICWMDFHPIWQCLYQGLCRVCVCVCVCVYVCVCVTQHTPGW